MENEAVKGSGPVAERIERPVFSRAETAAYLGIHLNTLDRSGIPCIRIGRRTLYRRETLDKLLAELERSGRSLSKRGPKCKR